MFQTAKSILKRDPAAHSLLEVLLTYPGIQALFWYRIAHFLTHKHLYTLSMIISQHCANKTGIFISPEARIGKKVFIDHGIGTVIGSTAIVEDNVTILHGVTLGSRKVTNKKRHPHIKYGALIGANAQILGPITIGKFSKVGAGAIVLSNVPSYSTVVGNPARLVKKGRAIKINFKKQNKNLVQN